MESTFVLGFVSFFLCARIELRLLGAISFYLGIAHSFVSLFRLLFMWNMR